MQFATGFLSWFGPLGVASVFYLAYIGGHDVPEPELIYAAGSLAIVTVVVHGFTSTPGALKYVGLKMSATARRPLDPAADHPGENPLT